LRLSIEGISLDLLYTQVDVIDGWETLNTQDLKTRIKDTKSILGCWEADLIIELVKQQIPIERFRLLLRSARGWAKSRGLYGNSWGFLGGFSWSLLCAYTCIDYPDRDPSLEVLLVHFFQLMSQHNWKKAITLTDTGKQYMAKLPQDLLPIVSSIEPCQNTARNITRSTAKILQNEFTRGMEISSQVLACKSYWASLYEPINLSIGADILLTIAIIDRDYEQRQICCGILGSNAIGLIIQLEQIDVFVRPNPTVDDNLDRSSFTLFLKLPAGCEISEIEQLAQDFICHLNGISDSTYLKLSLDNLAQVAS
jgi:poly(A) polymerase